MATRVKDMDGTARHIGAPLAAAGGLAWIVLWVAFTVSHGLGPENQRGLVFGLTWMDVSRFLLVPISAISWEIVQIVRRARRPASTVGGILTVGGLVVISAGIVVGRWTLPWGSYTWFEANQDAPTQVMGGMAMALGSLVTLFGSAVFGIGLLRARLFAPWVAAGIIVSGFFLFPWVHETPYGFVYGLLWFALAFGLRTASTSNASTSSPGES